MKDSLQLRTLERNGLRVTPIGFGLAAVGRPGYINLGHGEVSTARPMSPR